MVWLGLELADFLVAIRAALLAQSLGNMRRKFLAPLLNNI
jgi:hypothetical protein